MPAPKSDRRQLLKAGVWTLPVVAVATAAPAFAASGANMSTSSGTTPETPFTRSGSGGSFFIDANLTLRNSGSATSDALTVTITVLSGVSATGQVAPAGWTLGTITGTSVQFISGAQDAPGTPHIAVSFTVRRSGGNGSESITAVVDPGAGVNGTITGTAA